MCATVTLMWNRTCPHTHAHQLVHLHAQLSQVMIKAPRCLLIGLLLLSHYAHTAGESIMDRRWFNAAMIGGNMSPFSVISNGPFLVDLLHHTPNTFTIVNTQKTI